ncbi:MAG TPA: YIP1 family protein [Syntrophomonadaceae bacterium]|nr:YIP1 family protein [Syntrophomonadaceae bacterium]
MTSTEIIYGILFQPASTLRGLGEERPIAKGLLTFFLVSAISLLFKQALYGLILPAKFLDLVGKMGWVFGGVGLVFSIMMLFVMTGVSSLLSELIFHKNNARALLCCLSFSVLPGILGPPLYYALALLGHQGAGWFCSFLVGVWVLVLQVLSLREALDLDTGQAILLYILPIMVMIVLGGLAFLGLMVTFPMPALN